VSGFNDSLNKDEALAILKYKPISSGTQSWLQFEDSKVLLKALDYDADEVFLPLMDKVFDIVYGLIPNSPQVFLRPTEEYRKQLDSPFVPCGYFTPQVLRKLVAETEAESNVKP
jgi:hypothetical protein